MRNGASQATGPGSAQPSSQVGRGAKTAEAQVSFGDAEGARLYGAVVRNHNERATFWILRRLQVGEPRDHPDGVGADDTVGTDDDLGQR